MELKFTKEQTIKVIQAYYKIYENRDVEVMIDATRGCEGIYEIPCANIKITVKSMLSILRESVATEVSLNQTEVTNIFKTMLQEENYNVESMYYDSGLTTVDDRYNQTYPAAYFNGISVEVKSNVKQKIK